MFHLFDDDNVLLFCEFVSLFYINGKVYRVYDIEMQTSMFNVYT